MPARGLIVIPCFNEEAGLFELIQGLRSVKGCSEILVIDDASRDQTASVAAAAGAAVVKLPINLGIGGAVQTGLKYAVRNGFDFVIQVDGDGQHPPEEIPKLIKRFEETASDLIVGSRFLDRTCDGFKSTFPRRVGIYIIRFCLHRFANHWISDPTSGFRLFGPRALSIFSENYPADYPEPVSYALVSKYRLRTEEVAVRMRNRRHGASSISGLKTSAYMIRVVLSIVITAISQAGRRD